MSYTLNLAPAILGLIKLSVPHTADLFYSKEKAGNDLQQKQEITISGISSCWGLGQERDMAIYTYHSSPLC